jgi:hypothetical protein
MTSDPIKQRLPLAVAAILVAVPAWAQRVDVCALVSCSASGQRTAVFGEPVQLRPAAPAPAAAPRPSAQEEMARDPWVRRFQGRETEDEDACLLNVGIKGLLAGKGAIDSHVLGQTHAWRTPGQGGR